MERLVARSGLSLLRQKVYLPFSLQMRSCCPISVPPLAAVDFHEKDGVAHLVVKKDFSVHSIVSDALGLTRQATLDLMQLGAVWRFKGALSESSIGSQKAVWVRENGGRVETSPKRNQNGGSWWRERSEHNWAQQGDLLRVHTAPRRFPRHATVDWPKRILHFDDDFIVLEKPYGVLSVPSRDNAAESCVEAMQHVFERKIYPCHQLDACAEGALLLAQSSASASKMTSFLSSAEKLYKALCHVPIDCGRYIHHLRMETQQPDGASEQSGGLGIPRRNLVVDAQNICKRTKLATLEIVSCREAQGGFEVVVRLLSGRTHQIRSQLAALGAPVVGDTLYGPPQNAAPHRIALQAYRLRIPALSLDVNAGESWWSHV